MHRSPAVGNTCCSSPSTQRVAIVQRSRVHNSSTKCRNPPPQKKTQTRLYYSIKTNNNIKKLLHRGARAGVRSHTLCTTTTHPHTSQTNHQSFAFQWYWQGRTLLSMLLVQPLVCARQHKQRERCKKGRQTHAHPHAHTREAL